VNRRQLLILGISAVISPRISFASGHNGFCVLRDSGGSYLPHAQIVVYGYSYETYRPQALASAKPQTVLVERSSDYLTAIRDARSGRLPPGSIAVFDRSRFPEGVLDGFRKRIRRISIYFNIPETLQEAKYVHGKRDFQTGVKDALLEASLPELNRIAAQYRAMGGVKIEAHDDLNAADWLAKQISAHGSDDLVILASHINKSQIKLATPSGSFFQYPTGQLPLIDESVFKLQQATAAGPTVWTVGCETWDLELGRLNLQKSELAFTTKISYPESIAIVRKLTRGDTLMEKVNRLQGSPWTPQRMPKAGPVRSIDENHALPDPPRNLAVVAEIVQDKNIITADKMVA
jgi:hypothetical protein